MEKDSQELFEGAGETPDEETAPVIETVEAVEHEAPNETPAAEEPAESEPIEAEQPAASETPAVPHAYPRRENAQPPLERLGTASAHIPESEAILSCRGLSKNYAEFPALVNLNLNVKAGGIVGLLGPNGSGKSTFIKLAMGMLQPSAGEIFVNGMKPCAKTKAVTAYLPDANYLCNWMRVEQQVNYYRDFFPDFRMDRAEAMLSRLGIGMKQKIKALSKGNKEKLGLILTMSRDAKLYILDEPIAGVDPAAREFILDTVLQNKPEEATIFLCTHLIADIEPILTHAIFLSRGQIVLDASMQDVREKEGRSLDELFREVFRW